MKQSLGKLKQIDYNLYEDSRGRTIMVDFKQHKAYLIPQSAKSRFTIFQSKEIIGVMVVVLVGGLYSWVLGGVLGVVAWAVLHYIYKTRFLPQLEEVVSNDIPDAPVPRYITASERGKKSLYLSVFASVALPIVVVLNFISTLVKYEYKIADPNVLLLLVVSIVLIGFGVYVGINSVKAIRYLKEKEQVK